MTRRNAQTFALLLLAAVTASACARDPGTGNDGRLHFRYESGNVFSGDTAFYPMLVGTHEFVTVQETQDLPILTATTSNASVVTVTGVDSSQTCCTQTSNGQDCTALTGTADSCHSQGGTVQGSLTVHVSAMAAGDTVLTVSTSDGREYDAVTLSVRPAARLDTSCAVNGRSVETTSSITVPSGQQYECMAHAFGADGNPLEARYGITATVADPSVTRVREPMFFAGDFATSVESFDVQGNTVSSGTTTLTFSANSATAAVTVQVQ